jgi:hypothetical protein
MLKALLGSDDAERVLLFISERGSGYGREIATFWNTNVYGIQRQLDRLEYGGILQGTSVGRTRVYTWNPRWPLTVQLQAVLAKAVTYLPEADLVRLRYVRRRPRRRRKPL